MGKYKLWKLENLKEGIDRFYQENNRFPTVSDLDNIDYLPSSRWIQVKFGGMVKARKDLGYTDTHLGIGKYRSEIARQINEAGLDFEHEIEKFLIDKFGEPFVHVQGRMGNRRDRIDFFVYNKTKNFAFDVTNTTGHFRNLQGNINTKIHKYKDLKLKFYIVVSSSFEQNKIDEWIVKKTIPLPSGWKIVTKENFIQIIKIFQPYIINL